MLIDFQQLISLLILTVSVYSILRLFLNRKTRTSKLHRWWGLVSDLFHDHQFLKIPEFNDNFQENQLFRRVSLYLNSLESIEDSDFTNLFSGDKPNHILLSLNPNQTVHDDFLGARLSWTYQVLSLSSTSSRSFILRIRTRDKRRVLRPYLQYIHSLSEEIDQTRRERRLYTNSLTVAGAGGRWTSVNFTHPATMETVAMDIDIKTKIKADLESFLRSKQYYHRLGRVWRRSYLLYGPSGTGKSSFVAAMAETLSYDVYDLDLSKVAGDGDLKLLLLQTTPRSIILVEDFDRHVIGAGAGGKSPVTMSGILNFMDGVVNSCCDERVMVFTMTTKDHIDPTVLRPGRVDVHIYFPLCDFNSFKSLASNYLGVREHKLFPQVEEILHGGATLSPAEISELMMANRSSPSRALKSVISALQTKTAAKGEGKGTPRTSMESVAGESGNPVDIGCRDGVKEIRNTLLYGILRRKSMRKSESFDLRT